MAISQKEAVMAYIKENGSITSKEAFNDLGITRLSAKIYDLKQDGVEFTETKESCKTRYKQDAHYVRYALKGDDDNEQKAG